MTSPGNGDCWNRIGVSGDRSCPELEAHVHCRNCPVFADAARSFFDRPAPEGYLADWARVLAEPLPVVEAKETSATIFRLHSEWLALDTRALVEVTLPRPVHRIPHRSNDVLLGLVGVRGQLQPCVSLSGLLGIEPGPAARTGDGGPRGVAPRLVVAQERGEPWAFVVDEVAGVQRLAMGQLQAVPATLANAEVSYSQAVFDWRGRSVGLLDEGRVFAALRRMAR